MAEDALIDSLKDYIKTVVREDSTPIKDTSLPTRGGAPNKPPVKRTPLQGKNAMRVTAAEEQEDSYDVLKLEDIGFLERMEDLSLHSRKNKAKQFGNIEVVCSSVMPVPKDGSFFEVSPEIALTGAGLFADKHPVPFFTVNIDGEPLDFDTYIDIETPKELLDVTVCKRPSAFWGGIVGILKGDLNDKETLAKVIKISSYFRGYEYKNSTCQFMIQKEDSHWLFRNDDWANLLYHKLSLIEGDVSNIWSWERDWSAVTDVPILKNTIPIPRTSKTSHAKGAGRLGLLASTRNIIRNNIGNITIVWGITLPGISIRESPTVDEIVGKLSENHHPTKEAMGRGRGGGGRGGGGSGGGGRGSRGRGGGRGSRGRGGRGRGRGRPKKVVDEQGALRKTKVRIGTKAAVASSYRKMRETFEQEAREKRMMDNTHFHL